MQFGKYKIRALAASDISSIKDFTDQWIGTNYFDENEVADILQMSQQQNLNASLGAFDRDELVAVRLTFAPNTWTDKIRGLTIDHWGVDKHSVAYFKSLFVSEKHQAQGLGKVLSGQSLAILQQMGARAVLCHSWLESPNNSSVRYLQKIGFQKINTHALYWNPIDYECTRCAPARCQCTAAEMIKYLN